MGNATVGLFKSPMSDEKLRELRDSFVEAEERPEFKTLAERFNMPLRTVYRRASEEKWIELRTARIQAKEATANATSLVELASKRTDAKLMQGFSDILLSMLEKLVQLVAEVGDSTNAVSTRAQTLNTISFSVLNLANSSKAVGLVSFERNLAALGKEANGKWNPETLRELNLTIN